MGCFFARKSGKSGGWIVVEETYVNKKPVQKAISEKAYVTLGFKEAWTLERAKEHTRILNKQEKWKRKENSKIVSIAQRVVDIETASSIFVPAELTEEFHKHLMDKSFGSDKHQRRIHSHFKTVLAILNQLKVEPKDYADNKEKFYNYFLAHTYSPDYMTKLLRIINMFGLFACKKKLLPFEEVPPPNAHIKNKIEEAYQESEGFIGESDPLTHEMLIDAKIKLNNPSYFKWLWISLWFGLRPIEVDNFKKAVNWKLEHLTSERLDVLWVYQSKLTGLKKNKRWKKIPIHYPEQVTALQFIKDQDFHRLTRAKLNTSNDVGSGLSGTPTT